MSKNDPSPRQQTMLNLIRRYTNTTGDAPTTQFLAEALYAQDLDDASTFSQSSARVRKSWHRNVLTIIGRLEEKGLVVRRGGRPQLTPRADSYFASFHETVEIASRHEVVPAAVPVRGRVRAGEGNDLAVDMSSSMPTIPIPDVQQNRKTYALEVEGTSMEHEGILGGDYVIVEEFGPDSPPNPGELIVTRYLVRSPDLQDDLDSDIRNIELSGPTLKYYDELIKNGSGEPYVRLGWKKDNNSNTQQIRPARIEPIGRVIGMYRRLRMKK
jgi:SOS-response transcriptional repressor LexA